MREKECVSAYNYVGISKISEIMVHFTKFYLLTSNSWMYTIQRKNQRKPDEKIYIKHIPVVTISSFSDIGYLSRKYLVCLYLND